MKWVDVVLLYLLEWWLMGRSKLHIAPLRPSVIRVVTVRYDNDAPMTSMHLVGHDFCVYVDARMRRSTRAHGLRGVGRNGFATTALTHCAAQALALVRGWLVAARK